MPDKTRINGWKSIARHLGKSERTIQLWEAERGLPVHRIPGLKGWTVYAYREEIDAWMSGPRADEPSVSLAGPVALPQYEARRPGILVMPFERRSTSADHREADDFAQQLIDRFASREASMRVLSWTTSRTLRERSVATGTLARELGIRYLVEGSIAVAGGRLRIDVRVVDAEVDQILLTDRFASARLDAPAFMALVVQGVVEHFALVLSGALVEPLYPDEIDPESYLHYLAGVRGFTEGTAATLRDASLALERSLVLDDCFEPARALSGLVRLQSSALGEFASTDALATARAIADGCRGRQAARVTSAFLDAALAIGFDADRERAERALTRSLSAMPASVALRGRLFERRSSFRTRGGSGVDCTEPAAMQGVLALDALLREPRDLFANVMRAMAGLPRRRPDSSSSDVPSPPIRRETE